MVQSSPSQACVMDSWHSIAWGFHWKVIQISHYGQFTPFSFQNSRPQFLIMSVAQK